MDNYEKKYKEALEWARKVMQGKIGFVLDDVLEKFPELKESDDERIRQSLIDMLKNDEKNYLKEIAWLEKIGKNTTNKVEPNLLTHERAMEISPFMRSGFENEDKVEPKFHEGDWVILTAGELSTTLQIVKVDTYKKQYWFNDSSYLPIVDEECLHLWTIQDAKDGDVLACPNDIGDRDVVFIFKNINSDEGWVFCYCAIDANGCFCTNNDYVGNSNSTNISPATKEQRELLFQKIKEAGYVWDSEREKLKKVEQKTAAWSEEDEKNLNDIIKLLPDLPNRHKWLKSLKDRYTWKPSDEQMESLKLAIYGEAFRLDELQKLYDQLKAL